ncbi:MAG TPA: hypothetical protein VJP85_02350 [Candidatus Baltobacteraceae bacterium]|nr:hypothetical protein [Candidatus Baltobacteraceae bacterium]
MASATWIVIAVIFAAGLLLLAISSAMMRSLREEAPVSAGARSWTRLVDDTLASADVPMRLDMVERLGIVDSEWSREILKRARSEENDPHVRSAIDVALER